MSRFTTLRTIRTKNFVVVLDWTYDDVYELDVQDENGDLCAETADKLNSGEWSAYGFRVRVLTSSGLVLGEDTLWGSIYADPADFQDHRECGLQTRELRAAGSPAIVGSYFSGMVSEAVRAARETLNTLPTVRSAA